MDRKKRIISTQLAGLWSVLANERERSLLCADSYMRTYSKGEVVIDQGHPVQHIYILLSGKVKIVRNGISGQVHIARILGPKQFFGIRSFLAGMPMMARVTAYEETVLLETPTGTLMELFEGNPRLGIFFLERLSIDIHHSEERILSLTQKHLRGRLADTLIMLVGQYGLAADGVTLNICPTRADLASLSNMTTHNAIRTLSSFAREQIVATTGRQIKIVNLRQLQHISEYGG